MEEREEGEGREGGSARVREKNPSLREKKKRHRAMERYRQEMAIRERQR